MANNVLSASLTSRDASPRALVTEGRGAAARLHQVDDYAVAVTSDASGSTYRIVSVPSNAVIKRISLDSDALSTSSAIDIGVYRATADGSAVVDQDFFASAVAVSSAVRASDVTNESGTYTAAKRKQPLWQAVGLSADPGGQLDIVATATATVTAGGNIALSVEFTN